MEAYALPLFRGAIFRSSASGSRCRSCRSLDSTRVGDDLFNQVFHPVSERLLARCDGVLRVGGASAGADLMVRIAAQRGLTSTRAE